MGLGLGHFGLGFGVGGWGWAGTFWTRGGVGLGQFGKMSQPRA